MAPCALNGVRDASRRKAILGIDEYLWKSRDAKRVSI